MARRFATASELTTRFGENKDAPVNLTSSATASERKFRRRQNSMIKTAFTASASVSRRRKITTREPVGIGQAAGYAVNTNLEIIRLTGKVFGQLFAGQRSVKDAGLAGPVGIVQIISQVVTEAGFVGLIAILAVISLNLGVFNLLPIPLLDGGQIMVFGIEKLCRGSAKRFRWRLKRKIQLAGLAVILLLMVFTLFLDISRFLKMLTEWQEGDADEDNLKQICFVTLPTFC